jgi:cell division protein FtsI/penicillin-binding protein 2
MDRARVGLLPPGSTGKLITDIGLLRKNPSFAEAVFACRRLPDHYAGIVLPSGHVVRDDIQDRPHGAISMREAVAHSCNAWHAAAGAGLLGPDAYLDVATFYNIRVCRDPVRRLPALMPETSYGQGELLVTPFQVARLAGTVAADGMLQPLRWTNAGNEARPVQVLTADSAGVWGASCAKWSPSAPVVCSG